MTYKRSTQTIRISLKRTRAILRALLDGFYEIQRYPNELNKEEIDNFQKDWEEKMKKVHEINYDFDESQNNLHNDIRCEYASKEINDRLEDNNNCTCDKKLLMDKDNISFSPSELFVRFYRQHFYHNTISVPGLV